MLWHPVFYFTFSYFLIGAIVILLMPAKKEGAARKKPWLKFATYFLIVHGIILSVLFSGIAFTCVAGLIALSGIFEILKPFYHKKTGLGITLFYLFTYSLLAAGFILFSTLQTDQIIYVYFLVITFDGFSQLTGQWLGKHKITPKISPGKTMEGFLGGATCCLLTALFIAGWIDLSVLKSVSLASGIVIISFAGDLAASWYKRKAGIKDFGAILPGHGGILDRFDSFIPAGCFFYLAVMLNGWF